MSDIKPEDYSCEILLEKTTPEKAKDSSFPTDAYNVTYTVDGEDRLDVCRAQKQQIYLIFTMISIRM